MSEILIVEDDQTIAMGRRTVLFEGAFLGLAGIPLGILSGIGGIGVTLSIVNRLMVGLMVEQGSTLRLVLSPYLIPAATVLVVLIIFISAYLPARKAAATAPIEAIRQSAAITIKGKNVKTSRLIRRLFGIEGELALKNLKRNRRRYRTTVFSLFISIVLFVSFSTFVNYAFTGAALYYREVPFDFSILVEALSLEEQKELSARVAALDAVERWAMVRELVTAAWLPRGQFGGHLQQNYLDRNLFPVNEENLYRNDFHLITLGGDEFDRYTAENGLEAETYKDSGACLRGILINKTITQGEKLAEFEPLRMKAGVWEDSGAKSRSRVKKE